ncbi:MAG TPA: hypothetical protein VFW87_01045 [Pirellulales bacterium]|nr:hypothetical protein [Pirellulales bacterium]
MRENGFIEGVIEVKMSLAGITSSKQQVKQMSRVTLTQRVAALEEQVRSLLEQVETGRTKDWRSTIGAFAGDDFMREVFAEGRKIREADRAKSRAKSGKKRKARS